MFPYFIPKPRAQLIQGAGPCDPQLIRWHYGLGRVQILAPPGSGLGYCGKSSSSPKGVDEFWKAAVGDLPARTPKARVSAEYDQANAEYLIQYRLGPHIQASTTGKEIFVSQPHSIGDPVEAEQVSDGVIRARVRCNHTAGLFLVRPLDESADLPQVLLYRHDQELDGHSTNSALLRRVSELTGGRFNPDPRHVFDPNGRTAAARLQLWPVLLAGVMLLSGAIGFCAGVTRFSTGLRPW
jgi:hypothetical protein